MYSHVEPNPLLGNPPNIRIQGRTYNSPVAGGYTDNHAQFHEQNEVWARKASASGNTKHVIAVKAFIGVMKPGKTNVTIITNPDNDDDSEVRIPVFIRSVQRDCSAYVICRHALLASTMSTLTLEVMNSTDGVTTS